MSTLTLDRAKQIATEKNRSVWSKGYNRQTGRRIFLVKFEAEDNAYHCVTHTSRGFECDKLCPSYKHTGTCSHIGAVVNHIASLDRAERTALLMPVDPSTLKRPQPVAKPVATYVTKDGVYEAVKVGSAIVSTPIATPAQAASDSLGSDDCLEEAIENYAAVLENRGYTHAEIGRMVTAHFATPASIAASIPAWVMR